VKLHMFAAAKINWTLEVLGRLRDGYHEVSTILQTVDICDRITLSRGDGVQVQVTGRAEELAKEPPEENLVFRAALALRQEVGGEGLGALIELEKVIPTAAGLGGGSSDAAAVLRGLNVLWGLGLPREELSAIGSKLGSDVPFFLNGGTARAGDRGGEITPLADAPYRKLVIAVPSESLPGKTAAMYRHLKPKHYSRGESTQRLADKLMAGKPVADDDIFNVFEGVLPEAVPTVSAIIEQYRESGLGRPHLAGSGPALFFLPESEDAARTLSVSLAEAKLETFIADVLDSRASVAWWGEV